MDMKTKFLIFLFIGITLPFFGTAQTEFLQKFNKNHQKN